MVTIIAGSRSVTDRGLVWLAVSRCGHDITEVVCGEAEGVDQLGKAWAFENCVPVKSFPVRVSDWQKHGKKAGPIRNEAMAAYAQAAVIIWDGVSRGTADMIRRARRHKLRLYVQHHHQFANLL